MRYELGAGAEGRPWAARLCRSLAALTLAALTSCGGGGGGSNTPPAPVISGFVAVPNVLTAGGSANLTGTFTNGTGVITPGALSEATGVAVTVAPVSTTTYTLTVSNGSAAPASRTATVTVVPPPEVPTITVPAYVASGAAGLTASVPAQADSTYSWSITGGTITAGGLTPQITFNVVVSGSVQLGCVVTNAAGLASAEGTASASILLVPLVPVISAPAIATANVPGLTASVPAQAGGSYAWSITGGTLTTGTTTNQVTFTAGSAGTLTLGCVVTTAGGVSPQGTANITVAAPPLTPVITAPVNVAMGIPGFTASVPAQSGCTYAWSLTGGTLTSGGGTSQITFTPGTGGSVQLACVVTNAAGAASPQATATCVILAAPPTITAPAYTGPNTTSLIASVSTVPGFSYAWTVTGGTLTTGNGTPQITYSAPASGVVTIGCTETSPSGLAGYPGTATTTVVLPPGTPAITAPAYVTSGVAGYVSAVPAAQQQPGNAYAWTISGDSVITAGGTTARITFTAGTISPVAFTCVATNGLGINGGQGTVSSLIVPAPAAAFTASQPSLATGGEVTLTATFSNGTAVVTPSPGTLTTSPWTVTLTPNSTVAYTLTVTNLAGTAATAFVHVPVGSLNRVAGSLSGIGSVDGTVLTARFYFPKGVASDSSGNLFVADSYNNVIRKVSPQGQVTTLAGLAGYGGSSDGTGTEARFNTPSSLALDGQGNLYVADTNNSTIRKIAPGGAVTTLAGAAGLKGNVDAVGASARFDSPRGLAVDHLGNLYVADTNNGTIRYLVASTGGVTTLAGGGKTPGTPDGTGAAATFERPCGVAVDGNLTIYVADSGNNLIRKMTVAHGVGSVTTLAGVAGQAGSADSANPPALFNAPEGLTVDGSGNIYVSDTLNCTLRMITPGGVVTTLAGTALLYGGQDSPGARFYDPVQLALDGSGNLFIADSSNNTIRRMALADSAVGTTAGLAGLPGHADNAAPYSATFNNPFGLAVDASGNLYTADSGNHTIRMLASGTGAVTTLAGTPGVLGAADGQGGSASFNYPQGVAVDASGTLYVADTENCTIRKMTVAGGIGVVSTLAGTGSSGYLDGQGVSAALSFPYGVAVDSLGNLYVADTFNCVIRMISPAGKVSTLAGTAGITGSHDGQGLLATFNYPFAVAVDAAFNVYVADTNNHAIRKISPSGLVTTVAGQPGIPGTADGLGATAQFNRPEALAVDANGIIYVSDTFNGTIRQITPDGRVSTILGALGSAQLALGPFPARLAEPGGMAMTPSGAFYLSVNDAILTVGF